MKYFVLKPRAKHRDDHWATASQDAILTYADRIREIAPELARGLVEWAQKEIVRQDTLEGT